MATTAQPQYLYMLDEDLYRLGNATSPRLDQVRLTKDVQTYQQNGVVMVRSTGEGISLITEARLQRDRGRYSGAYAWKVPANMSMPSGLALHADIRGVKPAEQPDHYLLCPQSDMPLSEYVALLSKLALKLESVQKL